MAPFDPNSLAALLQMTEAPQPGVPGFPLKPAAGQQMGNIIPATELVPGGKIPEAQPGIPGMGREVDNEAMGAILGPAYNKIPGRGASKDEDPDLPRKGSGEADKDNSMQAILGMEALKQLGQGPAPKQLPTLSTGAAPRGQQVKLTNNDRKQYDVDLQKATLAALMLGR